MSKSHQDSKHHQPTHQRGVLLTIAIIFVVFHGAIYTGLTGSTIRDQSLDTSSIFLIILFLSSAADVVAGIAMWYWKRWGIYLYFIASVTAATIFLILTGSIWMFFGAYLPMVIVGYIVYPTLKYFT